MGGKAATFELLETGKRESGTQQAQATKVRAKPQRIWGKPNASGRLGRPKITQCRRLRSKAEQIAALQMGERNKVERTTFTKPTNLKLTNLGMRLMPNLAERMRCKAVAEQSLAQYVALAMRETQHC